MGNELTTFIHSISLIKTHVDLCRYQVYEVKAKDKLSFDVLVKLRHESANYDFWTKPRRLDHRIQIMVAPENQQNFVELLQAFNIEYTVRIPNVQRFVLH